MFPLSDILKTWKYVPNVLHAGAFQLGCAHGHLPMSTSHIALTTISLSRCATDNHENIPDKQPVPGKAIVYKGASPVKEEPFTFDK